MQKQNKVSAHTLLSNEREFLKTTTIARTQKTTALKKCKYEKKTMVRRHSGYTQVRTDKTTFIIGLIYKIVKDVHECEGRMSPYHPGTRISHRVPDPAPKFGVIAVGRAFLARWFLFSVSAFFQTFT
jgi:hypothetical protein